ncbi:MAG: flagellar hook-associated protein FlgL [Nitrospinae bacterium]|nr:flagellar hook-associated protein FlgL [Nitrospinota bacterium]
MYRITNRMMYDNTLYNTFRNNQGLLASQEQLSSGKRINKPSDDPIGMMEVLKLRTVIGRQDQYIRVMGNADATLSAADSILGLAHDELKTGKELAIQAANATSDSVTRATTARRIDSMIEQMTQYGNTRVGQNYLFSGASTSSVAVTPNGEYGGSGLDWALEINQNSTVPVSTKASDFLTADMNPAASGATTLASLNNGAGVPAGTFTVTDRAGNGVAVNTAAMTTLNDVVNAINAGGTNVTASLSTDGTALVLTDVTASPTLPISVVDGGAGTAQGLGIAGVRSTSVFIGSDINPAVTDATPLASLYGGQGLPLDPFRVVNGGASATITFVPAPTTVGALRVSVNNQLAAAGVNATITIEPTAQRRLTITSTNPATVAFVAEVAGGQTAELMGLGGGRNIIPTLKTLSAALKANDTSAILGSIDLLDSVMNNTNAVRGSVGARANQVIQTRDSVEASKLDNTKTKSFVEDADFLKAASELAMLQTAYQATLKSSASIIQPTLMDFVR